MKNSQRYIAIAVSVLLLAFFLYTFSTVVAYVLVSWVLSMIGQPLMSGLLSKLRFGKFKAGPALCAAITLVAIFGLAGVIVALFVPLVVEQMTNLAGVNFAAIAEALQQPFEAFQSSLARYGLITKDEPLETILNNFLSNFFQIEDMGNLFTGALSVSGSILIGLFSVVFITFFFLKEQGLFTGFLVSIVPQQYVLQVEQAVKEITFLLSRYFSGILLQITIITIYVTFWLRLLGIENALLIAFFAGLINVIPYLGPIIGATFGAFIVVASHLDLEFYTEMLPLILKVLAVFASMQLIDNFILQPFIFSTSVMAHPLEIFIIILMGAQLGGIPGMVLAIPTYTMLRVIAKVFFQQFTIVQNLTRRMKGKESELEGGSRKVPDRKVED